MRTRGFTLIELMVAIVILLAVGIMASGVLNAVNGAGQGSNISIGINGVTESRCIEGYKFVIGQDGNTRQILDEFGKGVRCEKISQPGGM